MVWPALGSRTAKEQNRIRAGFKGGGKLCSCPGPPQKNSKKLVPKETQKYFMKLIIWNKK